MPGAARITTSRSPATIPTAPSTPPSAPAASSSRRSDRARTRAATVLVHPTARSCSAATPSGLRRVRLRGGALQYGRLTRHHLRHRGKVITPVGRSRPTPRASRLQSDGKILLGGYTSDFANSDFAVVRYTADGALDTTFGTGGKVTTPVGLDADFAYSVTVQGDGKILLGGYPTAPRTVRLRAGALHRRRRPRHRFRQARQVTTAFGTGGRFRLQRDGPDQRQDPARRDGL